MSYEFFDELEHEDDLESILEEDNPGCEECGDDATTIVGGKYDKMHLCDACAEAYDYITDDEY